MLFFFHGVGRGRGNGGMGREVGNERGEGGKGGRGEACILEESRGMRYTIGIRHAAL